jgi:hypothetical protein
LYNTGSGKGIRTLLTCCGRIIRGMGLVKLAESCKLVYGRLLGLSAAEIARLREQEVI